MRPSLMQVLGYGAIGVAVLVIGTRAVGASSESADASPVELGGRLAAKPARSGLVVHVAGAVRRPGVYEIRAGARVADAVERAGGPTRAGQVNAVNLAAPLADGQQVVIPSAEPGAGAVSSASSAGGGPISLGSATAADLEEIEGIGPVTAAAIIEYRDAGNPVSRIEDLDAVSGIGPATIESLRARLQP